MDFCIRLRTSLLFGPNNLCSTASSSHDQPPRTSIIMLCCSTVYPLYCCFSSHLNGPYFKVFSSSFRARLSIHGQLISSVALAWTYDWLYGRRLYWLSLPGSLHTRERPRILVLRYSRIQASASPGNTRVAPHQLASDLAAAQKTESSRHYVWKDIYSAPEQDCQSRREGHSLETYSTICKELHFPG